MKLGRIDNVLLLGGSPLLAEFAKFLKTSEKYSVTCFSCPRQLSEVIGKKGESLDVILQKANVPYFTSDDVCNDEQFLSKITESTLAVGFGEVWTFDKKTVDLFNGRLLDFMGIPLPRYRGGAHYTWQILTQNKMGCSNLQLINEDMVQGVYDSGEIIKSREYAFPPTARTPQDYFDAAIIQDMLFLKEFLAEVEADNDFSLTKLDEDLSMYFPRLYTLKHGFINWAWGTRDIESFICAFDAPYAGASTYIGNRRVFLKECSSETKDGSFHPFQAGLIYKKTSAAIYVATVDGTIVIRKVFDEEGALILNDLKVGQRLFTPAEKLEESMQYSAVYDKDGVV